MKEAPAEFFDTLAASGHQSLLGTTTGTIRIDATDDRRIEHWFVDIRNGDIEVSNSDAPADVVIRMGTDLLCDITAGRENVVSALLRGDVEVEGDLSVAMSFERLFPGPPDSGRTDGE